MHEDIEISWLDELRSEADRSLSQGDTLDMKANIWLVVITFLATQTVFFLGQNLTPIEHSGQILSVVLFVIAGAITLIELCPRTYLIYEPSNGAIEDRRTNLEAYYAQYEDSGQRVESQLLKDQLKWAKERIAKNQSINRGKSKLVVWSFWLTAAGATINFLTLLHFVKLPF